jgi:hypothetical protein
MNLIRAEANRFFSRRFILAMMGVLIVAFLLTVLTVIGKSKTPTPEMWSDARVAAANARTQSERMHTNCLRVGNSTADCERFNPNRIKDENYLWGVFNFAREIHELVYFLIAFLCFFALLVSASFIGSELNSGGVTNLLLWRPHRMAVLGAKLGVAVGSVAVISLVFSAIYVGTFYVLAQTTGWIGDTDTPNFWPDLTLLCVRGIALALIVSALSFAVATIGRHTAATLGAAFGYLVLWEVGARIVVETLNMAGRTQRDHWFLSSYVSSWVVARDTNCVYCFPTTTIIESTVVFAALLALFVGLAFTTFHRRDLT